MKKYIQSLRLFFGRVPLRQMLIFLAVVAFFVVLFAGLNLITSNGDFINGMFEGISAMIGPVAAMMGIMQLIAVYNSCYREVPGYKYFRSVPYSGVQLSRGIIAANALSIISGIAMLALTFVMLFMQNCLPFVGILAGGLVIFAAGLIFAVNYAKKKWGVDECAE